jgi:hypothetical protein
MTMRGSIMYVVRLLSICVLAMMYTQAASWAQSPGESTQSPTPSIQSDSSVAGSRELRADERSITLPGGTAITVAASDKVSSATAKVGDTFNVKVTQAVVVGDDVVIAKGAGGQGEVLSVEQAGSHGHAGSLGIRLNWVYAVDGKKVRLSDQRKTDEGKGEAGVSSTVTIISWAFLGLAGLFAHNFVRGHDLELDDTHPLTAYVDATVHVIAKARASADDGFAH